MVAVLFQRLFAGGSLLADADILGGISEGGPSTELTFVQEEWNENTRVEISGARGTCSALINGKFSWKNVTSGATDFIPARDCFIKRSLLLKGW